MTPAHPEHCTRSATGASLSPRPHFFDVEVLEERLAD
jgi:hypothetical protein